MRTLLLGAIMCLGVVACSKDQADTEMAEQAAPEHKGVVNVYSARHYDSDAALYEAFEAQTGYRVRVREAGATQLLETMKAEGDRSPADVIVAADAGALYQFKRDGLTQGIEDERLIEAIPERFRDEEGHLFGLAKRARVIVYDPERLDLSQVDEYADLADPELGGEVCIRSSANVYNLSFMAELIERVGEEAASEWADAVVSNFARPPQGGDTQQIEAIAAGLCSAGLINHYYWVRMAESGSANARAAAAATQLSFPRFADAGTHVNITGAAIAAHAPNREAAIAFIEYLATLEGQRGLVVETQEFPLTQPEAIAAGSDKLPAFDESDMPLEVLGERQGQARAVYLRAGWD